MPTFSYNATTPVAANPPSQSPPAFVTNFTSIQGLLAVDHASFNDSNGGYHNKSTYPVQGSNPTTASGQITHYSKTVSGNSEEFVIRDGSVTPIQMTSGNISAASSGYTFLPGGIKLMWGNATVNTSGTAISFPSTFTTCWQVVATPQSTQSRGVAVNAISTTGFTAYSENNGTIVRYFAIGN